MNGGIPTYDGPPSCEGIWEKLPELTQWVYPMPLVTFGVAESKQIGLSEDSSHIRVPIFYSNDPLPLEQLFTLMQISTREVIDLVFFQKFAEFISHVLNSTSSKFYHIRWIGLYENIICMNREHIQHVTGFSDVIMKRVVNSIHVVLGDWYGYMSLTIGDGDWNFRSCYTGSFFTDKHLTRTCFQQYMLDIKKSRFSTMYLANIVPGNPLAGQEHEYFLN